jgi:hypothetical protein
MTSLLGGRFGPPTGTHFGGKSIWTVHRTGALGRWPKHCSSQRNRGPSLLLPRAAQSILLLTINKVTPGSDFHSVSLACISFAEPLLH